MLDFESTRGGHSSGPAPMHGSRGEHGHAASAGNHQSTSAALAHWLTLSLDHVGRGMLLVGRGGQLLHANRLARSALAAAGPALHINQGRLCAHHARDDKLLADAIEAALNKGLRRMLTLGRNAPASTAAAAGGSSAAITVAVLPISAGDDGREETAGGTVNSAVLISLPQSSRSKDLAVQTFAREHGCTGAETTVLEALLAGLTPEAIAQVKKVQLCTVRTQIGQLRLKTGSHTIRELLDRVAGLPPMMVVVQ